MEMKGIPHTMAVRVALRSVASLLIALGLAGAWALTAAARDSVAFTITDPRITESSGLAADPAAEGYWTVNDSGDSAVAYGLSTSGTVVGTMEYRAEPIDVEAVALHDGRLYVADIGDNLAERGYVTVYYFDDARADDETVSYRSWDFTYPDGPHDAETLLVDESGRLFVVTKDAKGGVYAAPRKPKRTRVNQLTKVGDAPAAVTDGTFLPGGNRIALLTYGSIEVIDAESYEFLDRADFPLQAQPESLTVSLDGSSLLVGSEGKRSKVYAVPIPRDKNKDTPAPTPVDSSSDPDPGPDPSEEASQVGSTGRSRAGTLLAIGLAGIVAIVAGGVVALVHKP